MSAIPYVPTKFDQRHGAYKECPWCGLRVNLHHFKDFESYSGIEFAEHLKAKHPEKIRPLGSPASVDS